MYEYNLFLIKREYYDLYKNKPDFLFNIFIDLKTMNDNLNYGITLYEQLCNKLEIDTLKYYLNIKYKMDNYRLFYIDHTSILLQPSRIIIKSREKYPTILKIFYCYNKYLFVCDFNNKECFWLLDFMRTKTLIS